MIVNFEFLRANLGRLSAKHQELVERCAQVPEGRLLSSEIKWLTTIFIWLSSSTGSVENRRIPGLDVNPPVTPDHPDLISIAMDGKELAVFHRNGMGPAKALHLILKTGLLDGIERTDDAASAAAKSYSVIRVPVNRKVLQPVRKVAKAKGATAPTTPQMASDISRILAELGVAPEERPIPVLNSHAKVLLDELVLIIEQRKSEDPTPATIKQIAFAEQLSVERGVALPEKRTKYNFSRFIDHALTLPIVSRQARRIEPAAPAFAAGRGADRIVPFPYSSGLVCLHDEKGSAAELGRGTHYSVFDCANRGSSAGRQRLAVVWDEDHDVRVLEVVERLRNKGLLSGVLFVGERKGGVTFILDPRVSVTRQNLAAIHRYSSTVGEDHWGVTVGFFDGKFKNSEAAHIVHHDPELVERYLKEIYDRWSLGQQYGDFEGP